MSNWVRIEHHNEDPMATGVMAIEHDMAQGFARTRCSGLWSYRQAEAHLKDWLRFVTAVRQAGKPLHVLADLSQSSVQKPEVAEMLHGSLGNLYQDGDHVAVVVPSSLSKMQMRRVLDDRFHGYFLSHSAAETWLKAWTGGAFSAS